MRIYERGTSREATSDEYKAIIEAAGEHAAKYYAREEREHPMKSKHLRWRSKHKKGHSYAEIAHAEGDKVTRDAIAKGIRRL